MKYNIRKSSKFKRDIRKFKHNEKAITTLKYIIIELSKGKNLDKKYLDHKLSGNYKNMRKCHILPDLLLIYKYEQNELVLLLVSVGSHSDLF